MFQERRIYIRFSGYCWRVRKLKEADLCVRLAYISMFFFCSAGKELESNPIYKYQIILWYTFLRFVSPVWLMLYFIQQANWYINDHPLSIAIFFLWEENCSIFLIDCMLKEGWRLDQSNCYNTNKHNRMKVTEVVAITC